MFEPFALQLFRRYRNGETVERLAADLQIPVDRVEQRIRAAAAYVSRRQQKAA